MSTPLLIFPQPSRELPRTNLSPTPQPKFFGPTKRTQRNRFDDRITNLDIAIRNESIRVSESIVGLEPERLLVFEIKGELLDFYKAVEKTNGMEFLAEYYNGEDEPDENYVYRRKEGEEFIDVERTISKRLFITINNQSALTELKRYWENYKTGRQFGYGTTKFRTLFEQLNDIRYYSVRDRYEDTGIIDYFHEKLQEAAEELYFEIELTYRDNTDYLESVFNHISRMIEVYGGSLINDSYTIIREIKYHSVIAKAPIRIFEQLTETTDIEFFKCDQILFFRPAGQSIGNMPIDKIEELETGINDEEQNLIEEPVIALFDGLPLQNHELLQNKLLIDDPENYEDEYPSQARKHGTSMASLILYGDLNSSNTDLIDRKIYVRPILTPVWNAFANNYDEAIPQTRLFIDIIHRAVKRIFDGEGDGEAIAPTIKVINLSIGDVYRPFINNNSSWARLIDWLSHKYQVLFIISTGNYTDGIRLSLDGQLYHELSTDEKEALVMSSIVENNFDRKIIAPSESINALTIGAYYDDGYEPEFLTNQYIVELHENNRQISPISRIGMGYLRSIKPDILAEGGRMLYRPHPVNSELYSIIQGGRPPGHKVAYPIGDNNKGVSYTSGTSNSTALTTRFAAQIIKTLEELSFETHTIPVEFHSVITKALLVHGATNENLQSLYNAIGDNRKAKVLPYVGNGLITNPQKVLTCTEQQVTLIGYGELTKNQSQTFELPLPEEISAVAVSKELTITLAWFTPLNFTSNKYRKAALYIDNISGINSTEDEIDWERSMYDYNASKRGTLQHLKYQGDGADVYIEDSYLKIKVNCREEAFKLIEEIKYGLAVTFELRDNSTINIYNEIRERISSKIRIS
ncbi:MAG: S8 family peptidase [Prolixibacteraceae bacterium]|nr:S8 family peptidase [Prolixibacteraceae bacterium]